MGEKKKREKQAVEKEIIVVYVDVSEAADCASPGDGTMLAAVSSLVTGPRTIVARRGSRARCILDIDI